MAGELQEKKFILIDDEQVAIFYMTALIKKISPHMEVISFKDPYKALEYFENTFSPDPFETFVLLDINMPGLTGWNVSDILQMQPNNITEKLSLTIVSSSIDTKDKIKAMEYSLVKGFVEKPLTLEKLKIIMSVNKAPIEI